MPSGKARPSSTISGGWGSPSTKRMRRTLPVPSPGPKPFSGSLTMPMSAYQMVPSGSTPMPRGVPTDSVSVAPMASPGGGARIVRTNSQFSSYSLITPVITLDR
jgi:hypothetical protein